MFALNLGTDNRVLSATEPEYAPKGAVFAESLPNGDIADYLCAAGGYVYSPLPKPSPAPTPEERIAELEALLEALLRGETDE